MQKYPMTVSGEAKLKEELKRLKSIERPRIIEAIATARALGDLKENAEYHAAREQQSFIEGRILDLEGKLANSQVIDVKTIPNTGKIIFGSTVTIINQEGNLFKYKIVGEDEVDLKDNKISYASPLGKSLIGKMLDDVVIVKTPDGDIQYEVSLVEYI